MIKPIKKIEEINPELIYTMTRDCMNIEWIKEFFTGEEPGIFTMMINKDWTIIIRAIVSDQLHHEDIVKKVLETIRRESKFCCNKSDIRVKV